MELENEEWSLPMSFITGQEGIFSPEGNRIYFQNEDIHYLEKNDSSWGNLQTLPVEINTDNSEYYATVSKNGNLYYSRSLTQGNSKIFTTNEENFNSTTQLNGAVNEYNAYHPFVAQDESFIIFNSSNRPDSYGEADLYISFKNQNGIFDEPINLGNIINSEYSDICPTLSPDGKYLFFTRLGFEDSNWTGKVYWVRADFINQLKPISINKNYLEKHVHIYPNPVKDRLFVSSDCYGKISIKLINCSGKVLLFDDNFRSQYIDLNNYKSGIYILEISTNKSVFYEKFLKIN